MDIKALPTIEPLINDLNDLHIGYYLKSNQFKKFCVRNGIENIWSQAFDISKNTRSYFSFDLDHEPFDCQDALILLLNHYFNQEKDMFYQLTGSIVFAFVNWSDKKLVLAPIIEDFELLKFPEALTRQLKSLA
jgi:hypothetical protein